MADYGIKGSIIGHDVLGLQDYLQSFNSSWPHLKVSTTGVYSSAVSHGLGYPPFFIITSSAENFGADGRVYSLSGNYYSVSSTALTRFSGASSPRYYIFRLDLTTDFTATIDAGSTTENTVNNDFGFKLTKEGADITSTDMRDYSLHSSTTAPLVQMVKTGTMSNTGGGLGREFTVNHGLGYTPTAFVFMRPGANTISLPTTEYGYVMPPIGVSGRYYTVDSTSVYVTADSGIFSTNPLISVVILKNPFTLETVNVSYP